MNNNLNSYQLNLCYSVVERKGNEMSRIACFPRCSTNPFSVECGDNFDVLWEIPECNPESLRFYGEFVCTTNSQPLLYQVIDNDHIATRLENQSLFSGYLRRWLENPNHDICLLKVVFDPQGEWTFNPWHRVEKNTNCEYIFRVFAVLPSNHGNSSQVIAEKFTQPFLLTSTESPIVETHCRNKCKLQ